MASAPLVRDGPVAPLVIGIEPPKWTETEQLSVMVHTFVDIVHDDADLAKVALDLHDR